MMAPKRFVVRCTDPDRRDCPAKYKIAAEWCEGDYNELKTFGFADDECLVRVYQDAQRRAARIRVSEGERLGDIAIFILNPDQHDYELKRAYELEAKLGQERLENAAL